MKKAKWLLSIVSLLAIAVSGCGSKDNASGADQLEKIKKAGAIRIAIEGSYPPYNYFNDKNEMIGFDVDVANELGKRMGVKSDIISTPWDSMIGSLVADKFDIIISDMAITEERKKKVDFSDPYFYTGQVLFVPAESPIAAPQDIKGKKIGGQIGANAIDVGTKLEANMVPYKTDYLAFEDLSFNRVEGVITDKGVGSAISKEKNYPIKIVGDVLLEENAGITLNKGQDALRTEINKALEAMRGDGTMAKISDKWFGRDITKK
ncbi:MAG: transporter substrate-binding domain-containing protein [Clostridia bacterium]